jgi:hypothetical protein
MKWIFTAAVAIATLTARSAENPPAKPVLLYSRHFNAEGESRYLPDGNYKPILDQLRADFAVRVSREPITPAKLRDVAVVLIANPSDQAAGTNPPPPHFSAADLGTLGAYIRDGGSLILMGNQENHNLEVEDTNKLLAQFGLQFTNLYTDAKHLVLPREMPVIGGLRWAYYTGNSLLVHPTPNARLFAAVTNDLAQPPLAGKRDEPGILLAMVQSGRGRVVAITDSGWLADWALSGQGIGGVAIREHDNAEIFRRLTRWAAGMPEAGK